MTRQAACPWPARKRRPSIPRSLPLAFEREGDTQRLQMPFRLSSRGNFRGHTRSRVHVTTIKRQRSQTTLYCCAKMKKVRLPVRIHCIRVAPYQLDKHENLPMAFKAVIDGVADWLGVDDRNGFEITYSQMKAPTPNTYGCIIELSPLEA